MKRKNLNVIIQAIACGTITLNLTPHLHGQQFDGSFQDLSGQMIDSNAPVHTPALMEIEVPGSAYYVGPDGKRLTDLEVFQGDGSIGMPQTTGQGVGERILSEDPIYDGENVYPMGTFPSHEFGERIISQTTVDENGKTIEVPGILEGGSGIADSDGMENGIPADQIVRPNLDDVATDEVQPPAPDGDAPDTLPDHGAASGDSVVVPNGGQLKNLQSQFDKLTMRHDRLKDRLSEANRSIEKLTQAKQKAEKTAKESVASMGEMLAGIENRSRMAKENSEKKAKAEAIAKTKAEAKENALKNELVETKQMLANANEKLAQPKPMKKETAEKLAALMNAKAAADAGLAKMKEDSGAVTSKLKSQIRELKSQLKKAESKVKDKNEKFAKAVKELKKDLESAKSKADKAEKALADANKKAGEAENELASKVKSMDSKLKKMESSMKEKLVAKEKAIEAKEKQVDALNKKLNTAEMEFKAAKKEMAEAGKLVDKNIEEMSSELKASEDKLKTLEREMEKKVASAMKDTANLKSELEQANMKATAANKAADDAKAEYTLSLIHI